MRTSSSSEGHSVSCEGSALAPKLVNRGVDGDPPHPRAERAAFVEVVQSGEGADEGLLRDVIREIASATDRERRSPCSLPVAAEQLAHGLGRPALRLGDEPAFIRFHERSTVGGGFSIHPWMVRLTAP